MAWSKYQDAIYKFGTSKPNTNLVIQAVAGSGKTSTLFELCKRLDGPILFLAFNKDIAEYAKGLLAPYRHVTCRTTHSYGFNLISKHLGYYPKYDAWKVSNCLKFLFPREKYVQQYYPVPLLRRILNKIRNFGMMSYQVEDIQDFLRENPVFSYSRDTKEQEKRWLSENFHTVSGLLQHLDLLPERNHDLPYRRGVEYNDMVRLPCIYNMAKTLWSPYGHVLLDEAQDTNPYGFHLLDQLLETKARIIAVGDNKQAIYAFRGSLLDSMERIVKTLHGVQLPLSVTYRCRQAIVDFVKKRIPDVTIEAHKDGGEVLEIQKSHVVQTVLDKNVSMIVGAKNRSLAECWVLLARNKIASSLKGTSIVDEFRDIISDIQPKNLHDLIGKIGESQTDVQGMIDDNEEITSDSLLNSADILAALFELVTLDGMRGLQDVYRMLDEMEKDSDRVLYTTHGAKGLQSSSVMVLEDWFETAQKENMQYVAYTRAADTLIVVTDWMKEKTRTSAA